MNRPKENLARFADQFAALSDRQKQVATLACNGLSNKTIAERLGVTNATVKMHLHAIYRRLGVRSRAELMFALLSWQVKP